MKLVIAVENPNDFFIPGQSIAGRVYCVPTDPSSMEIKVKLYGEECTYYTEPTQRTSNTNNGSWKEFIFKSEDAVIGSGHLGTAEHKFPFTLTLPLRLPSSYSGRYGYLKYILKAEAISFTGEIENEDEIELKVISPINLNDLKNVSLVPNTCSRELKMCRWFCLPEELDMEVKLDKNAFVLGETVNIAVKLFNNTFIDVSTVCVELYHEVNAKVSLPNWKFLTVRQWWITDRGAGFRRHRTNKYLFQFKIPDDVEIPNFENCTLLRQKLVLEVIAVLEDSAKPKLKMKVELALGHYSLDRQEEVLKTRRYASQLVSRPVLYPTSQNSPRSSTEQRNIGLNQIPPYPVLPKSELFNDEKLIVPVPQAKAFFSCPEKDMNLPYPPSHPFPYPKEDHFSSAPYPTVYPLRHSMQYSKRQSYSAVDDSSYPREESKDLPYPKGYNCSSAPYPIESNPPYPNGNSTKSRQSYPTNLPYPKSKDLVPYPKESNFSSAPYPVGSNPPYPNANSRKSCQPYSTVADPPYPKGDNFSSALYPSGSVCPYPTGHVLKKGHASFIGISEFPTQMPMPPQSLQRDILPYPIKPQAPYPTSELNFSTSKSADFSPPTNGNVAPYPLEQPRAMPMPSNKYSITCGTIGFAVPTLKSLHSIKSLEEEEHPSATLLPALKTSPIAELEELDDLLLIDTDNETSKTELKCSRQLGSESSCGVDTTPPPSYDEAQQSSKKKKNYLPKLELLLAS